MTMTIASSRPYQRLTPDNAVLLLIDHQIGPLWELEFADVRRAVAVFAKAAASLGVPTVLTMIAPDQWGPVIPELGVATPDADVIERTHVNAWNDVRVRNAVEAYGRPKLIIAGSVLEVGVVLCARAAARDGHEVYAALDVSGQASHSGIVTLMESGVIVTCSTLVLTEITREPAARTPARRVAEDRWTPAVPAPPVPLWRRPGDEPPDTTTSRLRITTAR